MNTNIINTIARLIGTAADESTLELWAESVINRHRFTSRQAEIAHRYGEASARQVRFPSADELSASSHDVVAIAFALTRGVSAPAMKKALKGGIDLAAVVSAIDAGLDTAVFSQAVMSGLVVRFFASTVENMQGGELNGALENFIESARERRAEPNPVARMLARLGDIELAAA